MRCENRLNHQLHEKAGKKSPTPKDSASEVNSTMALNGADLNSFIAEELKSSFEGLRHSMKTGFTGLSDFTTSHADEEPDDANDDGDSNGFTDDDESLFEGEPPVKKSQPGKTEIA